MTDTIFIGVIVAFFLLANGYVVACERLKKGAKQ
jgi:hypothetical protein